MVHTIDTPGAVAGQFSAGNPFAGISATEVGADWLNSIQAELVNLIRAAGLTPSKVNDSQVLAAVQLLAGSGALSATNASRLLSARALGSPIAGEFRRALDAVRCQITTDLLPGSGWRVPRLRSQTYDVPLSSVTIPAHYFEHGGTLDIELCGWVKAGSINAQIGLGIQTDGNYVRPLGTYGGIGTIVNNFTLGNYRILRLANSSAEHAPAPAQLPFRYRFRMESLGQDAAHDDAWIGPGTNDAGPGNTICSGSISFGHLRHAKSLTGPSLDTHWNGSSDFAKGDLVHHLGQRWVCIASHESANSIEPGRDTDWHRYWDHERVVYEWDFANAIDWTEERILTLDLPSAYNSDPAAGPAWAAGSFSANDIVTHSGNVFMCVESHSPDANKEPGDSTGGKDGERYWERILTGHGDEIHYSRVSAWIKGGAEGAGALL